MGALKGLNLMFETKQMRLRSRARKSHGKRIPTRNSKEYTCCEDCVIKRYEIIIDYCTFNADSLRRISNLNQTTPSTTPVEFKTKRA